MEKIIVNGEGERIMNKVVSEKTLINKVFKGIQHNGWTILNGLGSGTYNNNATQKTMIAPLVEYLKSKGIEVK